MLLELEFDMLDVPELTLDALEALDAAELALDVEDELELEELATEELELQRFN